MNNRNPVFSLKQKTLFLMTELTSTKSCFTDKTKSIRDLSNQAMHLSKQNDTHFTNNTPSNTLTKDLKIEMSYSEHKNLEKHAP